MRQVKQLFVVCIVMAAVMVFAGTVLAKEGKKAKKDVTKVVNINTATEQELKSSLKGIGKALAKKIVEYRDKNGLFKAPEDLLKVSGIKKDVLEKNKGRIVVDGGAVPPAPSAAPGITPPPAPAPAPAPPAPAPAPAPKKTP